MQRENEMANWSGRVGLAGGVVGHFVPFWRAQEEEWPLFRRRAFETFFIL